MNKLKILVLVILLLVAVSFSISCAQKQKETTVKLYYYNPELDKDNEGNILCSEKGLVPVERKIKSENIIEDTIKLLIEGKLTDEEKAKGITTEFPLEGFKLLKSELKNGVLTLTFDDPYFKSSGGACRAKILWIQIEYTAKQFPEVKEVKFLPEELFQP
ncbi:MAG: GerMN domain-containing protein [Caldisericia bacterium]|nr:GerMN domain-containing protein [Caldisericia bacterium]